MRNDLHANLTVRIFTDRKCFGPGVAELLRRVRELHSLRAAAMSMNMAYSKAWTVLRPAQEGLGVKLLRSSTGGRNGGGATLTAEGERLLRLRGLLREADRLRRDSFRRDLCLLRHADGGEAGMIYNILAVGDVVGACGVKHLSRCLRSLKKRKSIHFTVVNGENAAMVGLTPNDAEDIFAAGADVITLGNHTFGKMQIRDYLDDCPYILRPANLGSRVPGRGYAVYDCGAARIAVMNLIGRCDLSFHASNPFTTADELLKAGEKPTFTLVDFHAEATSEKLALAYYLDGRVSALWGTHTHVPTADEEVFPKGTGYLTDLGMTGAVRSVLGIEPQQSVETFLGGLAGRYRAPEGPCKLQGAVFSLDSDTGLCVGVERVDVR